MLNSKPSRILLQRHGLSQSENLIFFNSRPSVFPFGFFLGTDTNARTLRSKRSFLDIPGSYTLIWNLTLAGKGFEAFMICLPRVKRLNTLNFTSSMSLL